MRQVEVPICSKHLSVLMAAPSSAQPGTHIAGLDAYHRLGGNCLHLHGEGGETHSKRTAGVWLNDHGLRDEFVVCTQICHDDWDEAAQRPIDRFSPEAVHADIAADLELIETSYLDLVYLDDRPTAPFECVLDALSEEIELSRVRAIGGLPQLIK